MCEVLFLCALCSLVFELSLTLCLKRTPYFQDAWCGGDVI